MKDPFFTEAFYGLNGEPISVEEWGVLFKSPERQLGDTALANHRVSTVWLGMAHGHSDKPLIFETMVFCRNHKCDWNFWTSRYSTKENALLGHANVCNNVLGVKE